MALDPHQRAALRAAKLRAVLDAAGRSDGTAAATSPFPRGAALVDVAGPTCWVLLEDDPVASLGAALAWAAREVGEEGKLQVVVDDASASGVLARRAALLRARVDVWVVHGGGLHPAIPEPPGPPVELPGAVRRFEPALVAAGVDPVVEHGELCGEVLGLEVARVVLGEGGDARLEVGVGRHDREATAVLHGDRPPTDLLGEVAAEVRRHRLEGDGGHPLARLAPERRLRAWLLEDPRRAGARQLEAVEGPLPRRSVQERTPACAVGVGEEGEPLVMACSVGVDLELVPAAADARARHRPDAELRLVVPERDRHPVTHRLAAALDPPAVIRTVPAGWGR